MKLPHYEYKINENFLDYEFISEGPKGGIKKLVRFTKLSHNLFNLAFGDLNKQSGEIDDLAITNNKDHYKVLSTVAAIVYDFSNRNKYAGIFAKGSTASRNRLYRMRIINNWKVIKAGFMIFGWEDGSWHLFEPGKNYEAFLLHRR